MHPGGRPEGAVDLLDKAPGHVGRKEPAYAEESVGREEVLLLLGENRHVCLSRSVRIATPVGRHHEDAG